VLVDADPSSWRSRIGFDGTTPRSWSTWTRASLREYRHARQARRAW